LSGGGGVVRQSEEALCVFQLFVFVHLLAVAGLFTGIGIEAASFVAAHRAKTAEELRAALALLPMVGPIMGPSAGLLILMGLAMVYFGGFGWQPWTVVGLIVAVALSMNGPLTNGRRGERLHAMAAAAPNGPVGPELQAALGDRFLTFSVAGMLTLLVCMLYVMSNKPPLVSCLVALALALIVAAVPALRVRSSAAGA
jgi:hypothetical protein